LLLRNNSSTKFHTNAGQGVQIEDAMLYSRSQWEIARPMMAARKKFRLRLEKWPDSQAKMHFILRHELATKAEKSAAGSWLFTHGYRPDDA